MRRNFALERLRSQPKRQPIRTSIFRAFSLDVLEDLTRRAGFDPIVWKFRLKVFGDCDSDAMSSYIEDGKLVSECWHAFVKWQQVLVNYCAMARQQHPGGDSSTPESLLWVMPFITKANVISVEELIIMPSQEP